MVILRYAGTITIALYGLTGRPALAAGQAHERLAALLTLLDPELFSAGMSHSTAAVRPTPPT